MRHCHHFRLVSAACVWSTSHCETHGGARCFLNAPVSTKDLIWMMSSIIIKRKVQVLVNAGLRAAF